MTWPCAGNDAVAANNDMTASYLVAVPKAQAGDEYIKVFFVVDHEGVFSVLAEVSDVHCGSTSL